MNWLLVAANVAVFAYEVFLPPRALAHLLAVRGLVPIVVRQGFSLDPLYVASTFLSYQFLHAGFTHLGGNLLYLWIFGDNVEDRIGHLRYLVFYLGCGAAAGGLQAALASGESMGVPCIGASGAVAGVLGAYFVTYPLARVLVLVPIFFFVDIVYVPALLFLGLWFLLQFVQGAAGALAGAATGVAWWAHVGGFLAGAAAMLRANRRRKPPRRRIDVEVL